MGEEVKVEVIRTTQNSLSKYIKKPPLTEKLLRKPPFRYLHDITTSVMKETGYLQGLFTQDELNPENIKDREAKIAFLEKLIAAVNLSTGISITARPTKIVAGLDVAKTNELLQAIGKALDKKECLDRGPKTNRQKNNYVILANLDLKEQPPNLNTITLVDSSKAVEQVLTKKGKGSIQQKKENTKDKSTKETKAADSKSKDSRNSDSFKKKSKDKVKSVEKPEPRKGKQSKDVSPSKPSKLDTHQELPKTAKEVDSRSVEQNISEDSKAPTAEEPPVPLNENVPETEQLDDPEPKHDVKPPPPSPAINVEQSEHKAKEERREKTKREKPVDKTDGLETNQDSAKEQHEFIVTENLKTDGSKPGEELKRPQSARAVHRKKIPKKPSVSENSENVSNSGDKKEANLSISSQQLIGEAKDLSALQKKPLQEISQSDSSSVGVLPRENKRPRTAARPVSARPGAPRVRDRGTVLLNETDNKDVSEPVNLIVDSKDLPKDDDETLVTVEASTSEGVVDQVVEESQLLAGDQGHLVSQILETQKELEENAVSDTGQESVHKVDISWSVGRQEAAVREVDRLRSAVQALTRAVNPLGKLMDFLQEDVDAMQTELETWAATNQRLAQQLLAEQRLTEECIEPLARQLEDIEQLVEDQLEEMSVVKANIIRHDERLARILKANTSREPR